MIIRAKAARMAGLDYLAFVCVFSTQIHNDGVLTWMNEHQSAVLRALDQINVSGITSALDARSVLSNLFGIHLE
jgi:hypothetical protein